ncbi:hypothetical protein ATANTOWER_016908 [Ataeniobius toweri]|uniref:Uncharacterized protein n=1 Tax=Ataeniobius toweri TaxID=208326 RepID=A0ABU7BA11_9TELE|nr:hypothetical protein [Ataeniobius toweri]
MLHLITADLTRSLKKKSGKRRNINSHHNYTTGLHHSGDHALRNSFCQQQEAPAEQLPMGNGILEELKPDGRSEHTRTL